MSKQRAISNGTRAGVLFTAAILGGLAVAGTGVSANAAEPPTTTQHATESAPSIDMLGDTILQVKNTTQTTLTVWRYDHGVKTENCYLAGKIGPSQTWTGQGHEPPGGDRHDINVLIKTEDGKPKFRVAASNTAFMMPYVETIRSREDTSRSDNPSFRVFRNTDDRDSKATKEEAMGDFKFGIQRLADVDSGHWYQANHVKLQTYINSIPQKDYDVSLG